MTMSGTPEPITVNDIYLPGPGGEMDEYPDYFEFGNRLFIDTDENKTTISHLHPKLGRIELLRIEGDKVTMNRKDWDWGDKVGSVPSADHVYQVLDKYKTRFEIGCFINLVLFFGILLFMSRRSTMP